MKTKDPKSGSRRGAVARAGKRPGTPVPTPDLDVTLAKRMKRRFSRQPGNTSSMLSNTSVSITDLSQQTQSLLGTSVASEKSARQSGRRQRSKPTSSSKSSSRKAKSRIAENTIDKYFEPGRKSAAASSPSKSPTSKVIASDENESVGETPVQTKRRNHERSRSGTSKSGSERSQNESSAESGETRPRKGKRAAAKRQSSPVVKRSSQSSRSSGSQSDSANERQANSIRGTSSSESEGAILSSRKRGERRGGRSPAARKVILKTTQAEQVSSSEDLRRRGKNRSDEDEEDELPKHVINKALSKLNKSLDAVISKKLSRTKQREIFRKLVDIREREISKGESFIQGHLRLMEERLTTEPEKVLANLPENWQDAKSDPATQDMVKKYSRLRSRVSKLIDASVESRQQLEHNSRLMETLQGISVMDVPDNEELQKELDRSRELVAKVVEKLKSSNYTRAQSSHKASPQKDRSTHIMSLPNSHTVLMNTLFDNYEAR